MAETMSLAQQTAPNSSPVPLRKHLFIWAVGGVLLLLGQALLRLFPIAWEGVTGPLEPWQELLCGAWVICNLYLEGYRGFQLKFVPRVVSRAHYLATRRTPSAWLLAPLFAMAFFQATRSARRAAIFVTVLVLIAIAMVRALPQPWRGIVDAGVVAGLGYGTLALITSAMRCLVTGKAPADPEVCEDPLTNRLSLENAPGESRSLVEAPQQR